MVGVAVFSVPTFPRGMKNVEREEISSFGSRKINTRKWVVFPYSLFLRVLQNHGSGCCLDGAALSLMGIPYSPPWPLGFGSHVCVHYQSYCLCFLTVWVSTSSSISILPLWGLSCWDSGGVRKGQEGPGREEEGENIGGEVGTWPAELFGAVGGFENVFTHWTHFHFQNSVFLAALIFSLEFYLTVFEVGQCSNLAALCEGKKAAASAPLLIFVGYSDFAAGWHLNVLFCWHLPFIYLFLIYESIILGGCCVENRD